MPSFDEIPELERAFDDFEELNQRCSGESPQKALKTSDFRVILELRLHVMRNIDGLNASHVSELIRAIRFLLDRVDKEDLKISDAAKNILESVIVALQARRSAIQQILTDGESVDPELKKIVANFVAVVQDIKNANGVFNSALFDNLTACVTSLSRLLSPEDVSIPYDQLFILVDALDYLAQADLTYQGVGEKLDLNKFYTNPSFSELHSRALDLYETHLEDVHQTYCDEPSDNPDQ
ncbi:hypothetical protein KJ742_07455 [Patescibacteria group bacterium]|nr:hypothetical protein [Patescibacteria group bacterium]MBU1683747.1 hypothetical protein [Patescibacteria group bacterium]MBU1934556.1 hypothetical protein [Patescibacteria group bacterium]